MMEFEYDYRKDLENKNKHGIKLTEAEKLWDKNHVIIPAKNILGEARWAVLGELKNRIYVCIFTLRNGVIRLISCHKADKKLERIYYEKITKK